MLLFTSSVPEPTTAPMMKLHGCPGVSHRIIKVSGIWTHCPVKWQPLQIGYLAYYFSQKKKEILLKNQVQQISGLIQL